VDRWATTLENLVDEVWSHDDTTWEVYIQWYTPRTWARVMYVPPHPAVSLRMRRGCLLVPRTRFDQHYDTVVSLEIHRLSLMVIYNIQFTNNFFCSST
jgi:hypothetical protein